MKMQRNQSESDESAVDTIALPILGRIGRNSAPLIEIPADLTGLEEFPTLEVSSRLPANKKKGKYFALEVEGDSMMDADILDGDYVIISKIAPNKSDQVSNGELVIAWIKDENFTTLNYYYKDNSSVTLKYASSYYPNLAIHPDNVQIIGKVVDVIRMKREQASVKTQPGDLTYPRIRLDSTDQELFLTPEFIEKTLHPILKGIFDLQALIDEVLQQHPSKGQIRSIQKVNPIEIALQGLDQAIEIIERLFTPWQREHKKQLAKYQLLTMRYQLNEQQEKILDRKADRLRNEAETRLKNAEAESIEIENERKRMEIALENGRRELALQIMQQLMDSFESGILEGDNIGRLKKIVQSLDQPGVDLSVSKQ